MTGDEAPVSDARAPVLAEDTEAEPQPACQPGSSQCIRCISLTVGAASTRIVGAWRRPEVEHGEAREILHGGGDIAAAIRPPMSPTSGAAEFARAEAPAVPARQPRVVGHEAVHECAPHSERLEDVALT